MALNISTGIKIRSQKVVLYGPEGIGKTTLASQFPDPLFIDTEGSTSHIDVKRVEPAPTSWSMLMGYVNAVIADPGVCSTLVIDTADWAERLCVEHVLAKNNWATIEAPGWGKGYREVNEEFGRLLDRLSDCIECGVNVVVTAHARVSKFEQPDELGTYDRWTLKLFDTPKASNAAMLKEWADLLLFLNYKAIVVQPDAKTGGHAKAMGGKRVMYTTHTPAWDAKNRCGLADELPMEYASIAGCIRVGGETATEPPGESENLGNIIEETRAAEEKLRQVQAEGERIHAEEQAKRAAMAEPKPKPEPEPEPEPAPAPSTNHGKLLQLMELDGVSPTELMEYCGAQGYCPADTPVDVYPEDFSGYLVSDWETIKAELAVPFK